MRPLKIVVCLLIAAACATARRALADDEEKEADRCILCHEQETKEWQASPHAQTMGDMFLNEWGKEGKKWECLVCHTSQFDRQSGKFSHQGVSCESCHGAMKEDHPDKSKMTLPVTSEVCQGCHAVTYGEWRVSAHGQKNIRCFDCHKMHQMQLRKDQPDQMCGTCHTERLKDFSHATHSIEGLHCLSCHMPEVKGAGMKIRGLGVRGHTFGVGAETCAGCHRDMVHASHEHATLEEEVQQLKAASPEKLNARIDDLEKEATKLRETVAANRRVFPPVVGLSFLLGIFCGVALPYFRRRKQQEPPK
ncbi:MAG TPA: multiheme c-type cytochrome [Verrucomicrobiae bacterium]|nr:multiheme c-type cytochrome [Verrucomicrobiae bacterium]